MISEKNKRRIAIATIAIGLSLALSTLAQDSPRDRRETTQQEIEERRNVRMEATREQAENRIRSHVETMVRRFNSAIEWLGKMVKRLESRIAKFKGEGTNTAEAEALLNAAKTKIEEAKSKVASIPLALEKALQNESLRGAFQEVRDLVRDARESIKEAHQALVKTIRSLKPGYNREKPATTTP